MNHPLNIEPFRKQFRGDLIEPGNARYRGARAVYNGMIDRRPRLIARCTDNTDVIAALRFGQDTGLDITVRGGGHSAAGRGVCDHGLVIDLSSMNGIRLDPRARTVRVGPGCRQREVDGATARHGRAVPMGILSSIGVIGLALSGGHGYLSRRYGLTCDNMLEAQIILADGRLVTTNARRHPDLLCALRGGGERLGIVTSVKLRTHPVSAVLGGPSFWSIDHARIVMRWYREFLVHAPLNIYAFLGLKRIPSDPAFSRTLHGRRVVALHWCCTDVVAGKKWIARAMRELPSPILNDVRKLPFVDMQRQFDAPLPSGRHWYWKRDFVRELSDTAIDTHLFHAAQAPTDRSFMHLFPIDGAVHHPPLGGSAWSNRDATWAMVIAAVGDVAAEKRKLQSWATDYWAALRPTAAMDTERRLDRRSCGRSDAGENLERARAVKAICDPHDCFGGSEHAQSVLRRTG